MELGWKEEDDRNIEEEVLVQWGMNSYSKFCGQ